MAGPSSSITVEDLFNQIENGDYNETESDDESVNTESDEMSISSQVKKTVTMNQRRVTIVLVILIKNLKLTILDHQEWDYKVIDLLLS